MDLLQVLRAEGTSEIVPGTVRAFGAHGEPVVGGHEWSSDRVCDVLEPIGRDAGALAVGDEVLIWRSRRDDGHAVILGAIRSARGEARRIGSVRDEVLVQARESLTLSCGEASITIRRDGKILIKGADVVSRAKRTNRIKGGAVSIN